MWRRAGAAYPSACDLCQQANCVFDASVFVRSSDRGCGTCMQAVVYTAAPGVGRRADLYKDVETLHER